MAQSVSTRAPAQGWRDVDDKWETRAMYSRAGVTDGCVRAAVPPQSAVAAYSGYRRGRRLRAGRSAATAGGGCRHLPTRSPIPYQHLPSRAYVGRIDHWHARLAVWGGSVAWWARYPGICGITLPVPGPTCLGSSWRSPFAFVTPCPCTHLHFVLRSLVTAVTVTFPLLPWCARMRDHRPECALTVRHVDCPLRVSRCVRAVGAA